MAVSRLNFRGLLVPLSLVIGTTLVALFALFWIMVTHQNDLSGQRDLSLLDSAIKSKINYLGDNIHDYSNWEDSVTNLTAKVNVEWANQNIGPYLYKHKGYSHSFVIDPDGSTKYASLGEKDANLDARSLMPLEFAGILKHLESKPTGTLERFAQIVEIDGKPAIAAASQIVPESGVESGRSFPRRYMIVVQPIDKALADGIAANYGMRGLSVAKGKPAAGQAVFPIRTSGDRTIAYLTWNSSRPGDTMLSTYLPWLLCIALLALGLSAFILKREAKTSKEAANNLIELQAATAAREEQAQESARLQAAIAQSAQEEVKHQAAQIARQQKVIELTREFEYSVGEVVGTVAAASSQLQNTATSMNEVADDASQKAASVSDTLREASVGVTAAATASDEFAMSVNEISRQAAAAAELARTAASSASEADTTISEMQDAALEVGQIVDLIASIAQRTNLLALNASIEAARGGEAGRGFVVVAAEVKDLANQISRATDDVGQLIQAIQGTTGASARALRTIAQQVGLLEETSISIASAVDQQSVSGLELARNIDLAARGTESAASNIESVRETALATGSVARELLTSSTELELQATVLNDQVSSFLVRLRAA